MSEYQEKTDDEVRHLRRLAMQRGAKSFGNAYHEAKKVSLEEALAFSVEKGLNLSVGEFTMLFAAEIIGMDI